MAESLAVLKLHKLLQHEARSGIHISRGSGQNLLERMTGAWLDD
jgi:hypothetical protein